jgi:hypothetical protein
MPYYHYTSRQAAQDIVCAGLITPGPSGRIYLTPTLYVIGQEAASALSIINKPVEMACEIPDSRVASPTPPPGAPPRRVRPLRGPGGIIIRKGGRQEVHTSQTVHANQLQWISLREP